jgi:hypothetical protein
MTRKQYHNQTAEVDLTPEEMALALAERVSHTRLTPAVFWNRYTVQVTVRGGELEGVTVRYYLEPEEGEGAAVAD